MSEPEMPSAPVAATPTGRHIYLGVSLTALAVIFFETVAFQALNFVGDYMRAILVVAIALLGIAVGGFVAFFLSRRAGSGVYIGISLLLPVSVAIAFASLCLYPTDPWRTSIALMLPFICASTVISLTFARAPSHRVYFYDLVGAAGGALVACISVPLLREEGSLLLIMLIGFVASFIFARGETGKAGGFGRKIALVMTVVMAALIAFNLITDKINMVHLVRRTDEGNNKVYNFIKRPAGKPDDLRYSRGSLVERIDIVYKHDRRLITFYNGYANDHISRSPTATFKKDRRLEYGLVNNPDVLVIGTAAEGIVKTAKAMGRGDVVGLDINSAVVRAMEGPFFEFSRKAYKNIELHVIDARSYFNRTDRKFDIITMMNTHRMRNVGYTGQPEYLHTIESLEAIFDHLTDNGWLVLEEREINDRAKYGIRRFVHNAKLVLRDHIGVDDPAQHFWVYDWYGRNVRKRGNLYSQIYIKKSPINAIDQEFFDEVVARHTKKVSWGIVTRYRPGHRSKSDIRKLILADDPYDVYNREVYNFEPVTDDRPFPFDVLRARPHLKTILKPTVTLTLLLGLLPAVLLLVWRSLRRRENENLSRGRQLAFGAFAVLYFALLGIGYLALEVVFMQKLQIFIGIPVLTIASVLGTMLFFSGLGSVLSETWTTKRQALAFVGIILLALAYLAIMDGMITHLTFLPTFVRVLLVILLLAPLSFLMGTPFPFGMQKAKQVLDDRFGAAMFGLNGAFSALATPLALAMGMIAGYTKAFLLGTAVYLVCLVIALAMMPLSRPRQPAP